MNWFSKADIHTLHTKNIAEISSIHILTFFSFNNFYQFPSLIKFMHWIFLCSMTKSCLDHYTIKLSSHYFWVTLEHLAIGQSWGIPLLSARDQNGSLLLVLYCPLLSFIATILESQCNKYFREIYARLPLNV